MVVYDDSYLVGEFLEEKIKREEKIKKELTDYILEHGWGATEERLKKCTTIEELQDLKMQIVNFRSDERMGY